MWGRIGRSMVGGFGAALLLSMLAVPAQAQEGEQKKKPEKKKRERVQPTELTLSGTIAKTEVAPKARPSKKKDGADAGAGNDEVDNKKPKKAPKPRITYTLTTTGGDKVVIPPPRPASKKKGKDAGDAPATINLDDYLDTPVTVTVMAIQQKKGEKTMTRVVKLLKIEKQDADDDGPADDDGDMDEDAGEPDDLE